MPSKTNSSSLETTIFLNENTIDWENSSAEFMSSSSAMMNAPGNVQVPTFES